MSTHSHTITILNQGGIIAYPTEAVYGLGCDPFNESAVSRLLHLKKRGPEKGLILIAGSVAQIMPYINITSISENSMKTVLSTWPGPVTWVFPASEKVPVWVRGQHTTIAVRVTDHPIAKSLCLSFGHPIISTSANLSNQAPARKAKEVRDIFKEAVDDIVEGKVGGLEKPTKIQNAKDGTIIR